MSNTTPNTKSPERKSVVVAFAALDPYIQRNIPAPKESSVGSDCMVRWGADNRYPDYLLELYNSVATLRSVIDGCADYIAGDDVLVNSDPNKVLNKNGDTARVIVRRLALDYKRCGGFAIQVIRDNSGKVAELYAIDLRFLRMNKDCDVFWYSEKWGKSNTRPIVYPAFMPIVGDKWAGLTPEERDRHASSILFYKDDHTQVYPSPCYRASIPSCEIERNIDDFHLNSLENGFTSSAVINFMNGKPSDEEKAEIERDVNEKFSGHENAARIMINFADDKDHAASVDEFKVEDFGERYGALEKSSRQKIFTAFRANPNLFGIPTENLGFSSEEYDSAFKLFNRTQVRPAQRAITDAFTRIYGEAVLEIRPFTLDGDAEIIVK